VKHGLVPADKAGSIVSAQGVKMGRPSRIHIKIDLAGGEISRSASADERACRRGPAAIVLRNTIHRFHTDSTTGPA
jgi:predicted PhzF superfamily epimerase YddE/YHI9